MNHLRVHRLARRLLSQLEELYIHSLSENLTNRRYYENLHQSIKVVSLKKTKEKLEGWFRKRNIPIRILYISNRISIGGYHKPSITPIGKKGVITYAYLPVEQDPPTAWIIVHNLSHALFDPIRHYTESPYEKYKQDEKEILPSRWEKQYNVMGGDKDRPALYPTTRSNQIGKIEETGEAFHEIFAQWVVKGKITLNPRKPTLEDDLGRLFRSRVDQAAERGEVVYNS